jgi:hypothetical protein
MRFAKLRAVACGVAVAAGVVVFGAAPAAATCATSPATNPITVDPPVGDPIVVGGIPRGVVTACVEVGGSPSPQVDTEPTVDVQPTGCGVPCFVVEWDGVTTQPVTVGTSGQVGDLLQWGPEPIPVLGGTTGDFCINAGTPCPE